MEQKWKRIEADGYVLIDNTGVYPQTEDCIDEMVSFIPAHCQG